LPKAISALRFKAQQHPSKIPPRNMKLPRSPKGFTLIELLVVISIIAVLASLAVPAVTGALVKGQLIQAMSNGRQVHQASMSMSTDGAANSDSNLGWPGDLNPNLNTAVTGSSGVTTLPQFVARLVQYDYLKGADLKVFATAGITAYAGASDSSGNLTTPFVDGNSAFKLYWVSDTDPSNTLFLATKNYTYNTAFTKTTDKPFGDKGFVVIRKGGDASILKRQQAAGTNVLTIVGNVPLASGDNGSAAGSESASNCYQTAQ
jgi:prepilin-type N-terminal cleavage/methylation domain-containing protein